MRLLKVLALGLLVMHVGHTQASMDTISGTDILNLLVAEGILSEESATTLVEKVRKRNQRAQQQSELDKMLDGEQVVRVPYVPEYVTRQLHESVKRSVEAEIIKTVKDDVVQSARLEGWGIKVPDWVNSIKVSGDGRVRYQGDYFPSNNAPFGKSDINAINDNGGTLSAGRDSFDNVTDDRDRLRARFRLMVKAKPHDRIDVGMRFVTGNEGNPVSSNQTLGEFGQKWDTSLDLAYIRYTNLLKNLTVVGGRFKNPWFHTDLVWDSDMTFEGVSSTYYFLRSDDMFADNMFDPFVTLGVFPLQEINQTLLPGDTGDSINDDKWLYAAQLGMHINFIDDSKLSMGLAWYDFDNVTGELNTFSNDLQDDSASPFFQTGNAVFNIANTGSPNDERFALASEFELINATVKYEIAKFWPYKLTLTADYVKNLAFDKGDIEQRIGGGAFLPDRDEGYQFGVDFGTSTLQFRRDWRVGFTYRRLEGDAVIDAFADSDFLLGGTDSKGYIIRGDYFFYDDVFLTLKWLSADSIDTLPDDPLFNISVDTLQIDLTTKF